MFPRTAFIGLASTTMTMTMTMTMMMMVVIMPGTNAAGAHGSCTHGKLYVSEADSTTVHVFDLTGSVENMVPEQTLSDIPGGPELYFGQTGSMRTVAAIYRGVPDNGYIDGTVSFLDTGLRTENHGDHYDYEYLPPSLLADAGFSCARPIHFVPHSGK